ncbi:MAG TPA: tetratricopeptide repeat protein [Thermoanaerobaculia bacterium]|jgi:tetratricopeptide (TPR) repeat protein|nr:tetratricopeptide repeat protein [Thermoanaerobaculia bacterium]
MIRNLRALSLALLAALALAAAAHAVGEGRIIGMVTDDQGAPLPGVKITFTRKGTDIKQEKTSDAKGKFTILVLDATQEYTIHLEKEGYQPYEEALKPKAEDTLRISYQLGKLAPAAAGPSDEQVKELEGKNQAVASFNEGVNLLRSNDLAGAAVKFEAATQSDNTLAPAYGALAEVYAELGKNAEALAAADRLLQLEPGSVRGLKVRFDALKALGEKDKMNEALEALAAVEKSRDTAIRIYNLGAEASRTGDRDAAIAYLKRTIEVDPTLDQAYTALGQVYMVKKSYKEAVAALEPLLARDPQNLEALTIRFEALKAAGDKEGAKAAEAAMKTAQASQSPEALFKQGVAQYNSNNLPGAIETLERAVGADPKHAKAHYMLGLAYSGSDPAKAKEHLQKFLELAPNDPDAATAREMLTYIK